MATAEKTKLEQRQREEAAERKEKGQKWETKLFRYPISPSTSRAYAHNLFALSFRPIGENWQFMTPLEKRLLEKQEGGGGGGAGAARK